VQGMSEEDMIQEALKASVREDKEHKAKLQKQKTEIEKQE
jgi:hypothetical protein